MATARLGSIFSCAPSQGQCAGLISCLGDKVTLAVRPVQEWCRVAAVRHATGLIFREARLLKMASSCWREPSGFLSGKEAELQQGEKAHGSGVACRQKHSRTSKGRLQADFEQEGMETVSSIIIVESGEGSLFWINEFVSYFDFRR